jgi:uncharacterized protein YabN with tetrapyrrole methylase and pyrophosphatase domain
VTARLDLVGLGMQVPNHVDPWVAHLVREADLVLDLVDDPLATAWLDRVHPAHRSLLGAYEEDRPRAALYAELVEVVLEGASSVRRSVLVTYGHPALASRITRGLVHRARDRAQVQVWPAVSSLDALMADVGFDLVADGTMVYEASDLLLGRRPLHADLATVVLQVGLVGVLGTRVDSGVRDRGVQDLTALLAATYGARHEAVVYEAATHVLGRHHEARVPLEALATAELTPASTLLVPSRRP